MISNVPEWWGVAFSGFSKKQDDMFIAKMEGVDSFFNFTVEELIPGKKVCFVSCRLQYALVLRLKGIG
jgi:hypothetical protein